jgi:hypothetical protein
MANEAGMRSTRFAKPEMDRFGLTELLEGQSSYLQSYLAVLAAKRKRVEGL